jgi:hypothetical protein
VGTNASTIRGSVDMREPVREQSGVETRRHLFGTPFRFAGNGQYIFFCAYVSDAKIPTVHDDPPLVPADNAVIAQCRPPIVVSAD